jgi:membrane-associated phospholipid phosphatase
MSVLPVVRPPWRTVPAALLLLGLGLPWAIFGGLLWAVRWHGSLVWDAPVLFYWHRHATPALDKLAVFLTIVGNTGPMVGTGLLVLLGLLWRRQGRRAWAFLLSVGGSMVLTQLIKFWVMRPRPTLWVSLRPEHTYSFPSGHAMDTAAVAAALCFLAWRHRSHWWVWALAPLFSLAVGWARMYLGVHNPSDVLAGWSSAVGWVVLAQVLAAPEVRALFSRVGRQPSRGALGAD